MKATVFVNRSGPHQILWGGAFSQGLVKHGIYSEIVERGQHDNGADIVAMWSVRNRPAIELARQRGAAVVILEAGYIERTKYTSLSLGGGLNGRGRFVPAADNGERFNRLWSHHLKPWKSGNDYALICGQVPGDMAVEGVDLVRVYTDAASECRALGFEPVFRPHPKGGMNLPGVRSLDGTLQEAFDGAAFAITWNSNSGVDAALAGVPVVALDEGSMVWEIAAHEVCKPSAPDRSQWAADIAWKQWAVDEMASGLAWDHLKEAMQCTL